MGDKTGIEWTDATWNAVTGCDKVSAGCDHCYAETLSLRLQRMGVKRYADGFAVRTHPEALSLPFKWREPRRVFVNSMSDLFHVQVSQDFVDRMFAVMALTPQHTYQILTKRPQRAANYLNDPDTPPRILATLALFSPTVGVDAVALARTIARWPLPNVWLGTSVEDARVLHRVKPLLETPAAVRFLSCEPLLGPLTLAPWLRCCPSCGAPRTDTEYTSCGYCEADPRVRDTGIHWVIAGGESGPDHRPLDLDWARALRDECVTAGVPFFFKQIGGLTPKSGGRELDGRTWDEFPAVPTLAGQVGRMA